MTYHIAWIVPSTGKTEIGPPLEYLVAEAWVTYLNRKYPDVKHWVEEVPDT